jgi:hypothetical protein
VNMGRIVLREDMTDFKLLNINALKLGLHCKVKRRTNVTKICINTTIG